jgi:hypothetical protein
MSDFVFFATGEKDYSRIPPTRRPENSRKEEKNEGQRIADCGMRNVESEEEIKNYEGRTGKHCGMRIAENYFGRW